MPQFAESCKRPLIMPKIICPTLSPLAQPTRKELYSKLIRFNDVLLILGTDMDFTSELLCQLLTFSPASCSFGTQKRRKEAKLQLKNLEWQMNR